MKKKASLQRSLCRPAHPWPRASLRILTASSPSCGWGRGPALDNASGEVTAASVRPPEPLHPSPVVGPPWPWAGTVRELEPCRTSLTGPRARTLAAV